MLILLILLLFLLRFVNLGNIPIFGDEALYLWLADEFKKDPNTALKSINYGVLPITIWLKAFVQIITGDFFNALYLGRTIQIISDGISAFLVFLIGKKLFDKKLGIIASFIYLALPLTFFNSRFALLDPLTNFITLSSIYISLRILDLKKLSKKLIYYVILLSSTLVLGFFTKPLAVVSYVAMITSPIVLLSDFKTVIQKIFKPLLFIACAFILFGIFLAIFYLPIANEFSSRFVSENNSPSMLINQIKMNLWRIFWWSRAYLTLPIILATIITIIFILKDKSLKLLWLFVWLTSIILLESAFSARLFPRHILMIAPPVSLIVAYFITRISGNRPILLSFIISIVLLQSFVFITNLLSDPKQTNIALEDKQQFYEDWPSGEGLKEVSLQLKSLSREEQISVFVENDPTFIWALPNLYDLGQTQLYQTDNFAQGKFINDSELAKISTEESYIILNRNPDAPKDWPVELIFKQNKGPHRTINIYKIIPPK